MIDYYYSGTYPHNEPLHLPFSDGWGHSNGTGYEKTSSLIMYFSDPLKHGSGNGCGFADGSGIG